jgi:hypothetical protein
MNQNPKKANDGYKDHREKYNVRQSVPVTIACTFHVVFLPSLIRRLDGMRDHHRAKVFLAGNRRIRREIRFRVLLLLAEFGLAALLGGFVLWQRSTILSRPKL